MPAFETHSHTIFYPRANNMPNLHMPSYVFQLGLMPTLFLYSPLHCRGESWELHFPESLASRFQVRFYDEGFFLELYKGKAISLQGSHEQAGGDWWMVPVRFCQWLPSILLRITHFGEAAKISGSSFPDILSLPYFLKACRGFPDLCSPSPSNGLVSL